MPLGQLIFYPATAWQSNIGSDAYAIVSPTTTSTGAPAQTLFFSINLTTSTVLGSDITYMAAYNRCQSNFNVAAT